MSTADDYTTRALALIRVANGQSRDVSMALNKLGREIQAMLLNTTTARLKRRLKAILRQIEQAITQTYAAILAGQTQFARELIEAEAAWAARQAGLPPPGRDRLAAVLAGAAVTGATLADRWGVQAAQLRTRVTAEVRMGVVAGQAPDVIAQRAVGSGGSLTGGALDVARRDARGLVDATTHSVGGQARLEAMRTSGKGINAVKWFAILDTRVCPSCAERADKLWDMDGKPIGHSIPFATPVLHPWCRCILLPMKYPDGPPEDGGNTNKFGEWLERQSQDRQDEVLGVGRAALWRAGKITTHDLIGQNGLVLTLRELQDRFGRR